MHDSTDGIGRICRAIRRETHSKCIDPERIHELADQISDLANEIDDNEPEDVEEEEEDQEEDDEDEDDFDDPDDLDYR